MNKTGIFVDKIDDKHLWLIYYHNGKAIYKQPFAQSIRDHLEPFVEQDKESGDYAQGFQPEVSFEKLKISKALTREVDIA